MALGVRKVYEGILRDGRAIIVTDKNRDNYEWNDIPDGSKFIDTETGLEYVKLKGQSDWVPAHIKNDGTICIAKDAIIETEVFYVKEILDNELICEKENGEIRHFPKTKDGFYVIEIENGTYPMGRNYLSVFINDIFLRTQENEGILEMTPNRFKLLENPAIGMKITAKYYRTIKIGNPYPRIFMKDEDPGVENAEEGDIWIDTNALIDQEGNIDISEFENGKIPWSMISGTPTTLAGYHISDKVSLQGHLHNKSDIIGFPSTMPANGGNAETAERLETARSINGVKFDGSSNIEIETGVMTINEKAPDNNGNFDLSSLAMIENMLSELAALKNTVASLNNTVGTTKAYIVKTYKKDTEWYRVWSDGWVEQGGKKTTEDFKAEIEFILPFIDDSYALSITAKLKDSKAWEYATRGITSISDSGFSVLWSNAETFVWQASGYKKD